MVVLSFEISESVVPVLSNEGKEVRPITLPYPLNNGADEVPVTTTKLSGCKINEGMAPLIDVRLPIRHPCRFIFWVDVFFSSIYSAFGKLHHRGGISHNFINYHIEALRNKKIEDSATICNGVVAQIFYAINGKGIVYTVCKTAGKC